MVSQLEEVEGITGVEIGLGEQSLEESRQLILAASAGELPIIANLPLGQTSSLIRAMVDAGACAISLGPPRGTWRGPESELIHGRLYGPGLFPLALRAVYALRSQIECPLIVTGGVSTQQELRTMLQAGASAVQLDSVLWTKPERVLTSPVE
jgi:dihydroorotate dehydrogenase (NAD+) catalytic subunit